MPVDPPIIPPIPEPVPSTDDPANFDPRADATLGALPAFVAGANASAAATNTNAQEALESAEAAALAKAQAELAAANAINAPGSTANVTGNINLPVTFDVPLTFTLDENGKTFPIGQTIRGVKKTDVSIFFEGQITAFNPGPGGVNPREMTINLLDGNGVGAHAGWSIFPYYGSGTITTDQIADYEADQDARAATYFAASTAANDRALKYTKGQSAIATPAIVAGAVAVDLSQEIRDWKVTANANITAINITNPPAAGTMRDFTMRFAFDGTPRTITWPASFKWAGGVAPSFSFTNGKIALVQIYTEDAGAKYHAFFIGESG